MAALDEKTVLAAEQLLKRPLTDEEKFEIYRISDIFGMKDVQSFLHLILVFKLHEATMHKKFDEMAALENKLQSTLENSVERILGEGAARIGADMGESIAYRSKEIMSSVKEFHVIRGHIVAMSITGILAALAYWLGYSGGGINMNELGGPFMGVLLMPAGWCVLISMMTYMYCWGFDNWSDIKDSWLYKCLLALQVIIMIIILECML
jgi:hypothetical protein